VTEGNPKQDGGRDLTDAELDALLAAADRELLEAIKAAVDLDAGRDAILREIDGHKLPGDAAMRRLYREMDDHDLPGDPPFDVEAGIRDLKGRLARDAAAAPDIEALIEASSLGTPAAKALRAEGRRMLYGDSPPDMDRIHATGDDLAAGRITAGEAYERFLAAGCLPSGARFHVRLRGAEGGRP
jgi:hypothetical protein